MGAIVREVLLDRSCDVDISNIGPEELLVSELYDDTPVIDSNGDKVASALGLGDRERVRSLEETVEMEAGVVKIICVLLVSSVFPGIIAVVIDTTDA